MEPAQELATSRQFVNVQIPVADVRRLLSRETGQLVRPSWPDPIADQEFVRRIGTIADLEGYGWTAALPGLRGERSYCVASKLARPMRDTSDSDLVLKIMHRRLFCTGVAWRFDLGLTARRPATDDSLTVDALAREVLARRFTTDGAQFALADIGVRVAAKLLKNTTAQEHGASPNWWVTSGRPLVLVDEYVAHLRRIRAGMVTTRVGNRNIPTLLVQHGRYHTVAQSHKLRRAL